MQLENARPKRPKKTAEQAAKAKTAFKAFKATSVEHVSQGKGDKNWMDAHVGGEEATGAFI